MADQKKGKDPAELYVDDAGCFPIHHSTSSEVAQLLASTNPSTSRAADSHGMLPCHYAVIRDTFDIVCSYIPYAGALGPDAHGMTPLHYAVLHVRPTPPGTYLQSLFNFQNC
jgi:ankyrin repeat protein